MVYFVCHNNDKTCDIINEKGEKIIDDKILNVKYLSSNYMEYVTEDYNRHIYNLETNEIVKTFNKKVSINHYYKNICEIKTRESDFYVTVKLYDLVKDKFSDEYVQIERRDIDKYSIFLDLYGKTGLISNDTFEEVLKINSDYDRYKFSVIESIDHPEYDIVEEHTDNNNINVYIIKSSNIVKKIYESDYKYVSIDVKDNYIIIKDDKNIIVFDIDGMVIIHKYLYSDIRYIGKNRFIVKDRKTDKLFMIEILDKNFNITNKISKDYDYIEKLEKSEYSKSKEVSDNVFEIRKIKDKYKDTRGLINIDGKVIADLKYSYINYLKDE